MTKPKTITTICENPACPETGTPIEVPVGFLMEPEEPVICGGCGTARAVI
jgi:hypothetical protein